MIEIRKPLVGPVNLVLAYTEGALDPDVFRKIKQRVNELDRDIAVHICVDETP